MRELVQALNKPVDAFKIKNKYVALGLVAFTIIINTVFEPILHKCAGANQYEMNLLLMLTTTLLGICTYFVICIVFWLVCKAFGSRTNFGVYISTWGITYFPTMLCSIIVAITEAFFYIFWNSKIWGMVFNILFVGILLWKTVLYALYLREVAKLRQGKMIGAFIIIGIFIIFLAMANGYLGMKTPIL